MTKKIGSGTLLHDAEQHCYRGDVDWYGFPIGVEVRRTADGLRCEFFDRPKPDWASIPAIDGGAPAEAPVEPEPRGTIGEAVRDVFGEAAPDQGAKMVGSDVLAGR